MSPSPTSSFFLLHATADTDMRRQPFLDGQEGRWVRKYYLINLLIWQAAWVCVVVVFSAEKLLEKLQYVRAHL